MARRAQLEVLVGRSPAAWLKAHHRCTSRQRQEYRRRWRDRYRGSDYEYAFDLRLSKHLQSHLQAPDEIIPSAGAVRNLDHFSIIVRRILGLDVRYESNMQKRIQWCAE